MAAKIPCGRCQTVMTAGTAEDLEFIRVTFGGGLQLCNALHGQAGGL